MVAMGALACNPSLSIRSSPHHFDGIAVSGEFRMDDGESAPCWNFARNDTGGFLSAIAIYLGNIVCRAVLWRTSVD